MKIKAYAKINLTLDVLGKREDNFHEINSIMQQIDLYDELSFEKSEDIILQSQFKEDIILRTIMKARELFQIKEGVTVFVKKNIPIAAGFGGGSADAAAALMVLNELWGLNLKIEDLIKIGSEIGSDVPFFLIGGSCFVAGKGEIVEKVNMPEMDVLVVSPLYEISTRLAYEELDMVRYEKKFSSLRLRNLKGAKEIAAELHNDFINIQKEDVKKIIDEVIEYGALNASITGKGPSVFAIFDDLKRAKEAYEHFKREYPFVYLGKTIK